MSPYNNKELFSDYYLETLKPELTPDDVKRTFREIKKLWDKNRGVFPSFNEEQLRQHFLNKVLKVLNWEIDVEPPTPSGGSPKHPDYALFKTESDWKNAEESGKEGYFRHCACVVEAKRWERNLDKKIKEDTEDPECPVLQISRYLWLTEVKWGILTNGRFWRLFERETSKNLDTYYEIDLQSVLDRDDIEGFCYFYYFFSQRNIPEFVEKVYRGSIDYSTEVGEELKENVYEALRTLAEGFLKCSDVLGPDNIKEVHENSLIFLYRILFVLYAEYRNLLPSEENTIYRDTYSLTSLKKEIGKKIDEKDTIPFSTFNYWNRLKELFEVINKGNQELGVPSYDGRLFDPEKYPFLEKYKVGDYYLAKVIDLLSRSKDKGFIDYRSLDIRHLGSIYEGLLEYKLKVNEREEVYLETDKGERKATGSYYTPDYIVKYIVENTLGPVIEEKKKKAEEISLKKQKEIEEKKKILAGYKAQLNKTPSLKEEFYNKKIKPLEEEIKSDEEKTRMDSILLDEILNIKVLDPAMGSGHFLVGATDFLAYTLVQVLSGQEITTKPLIIKEPEEEPYKTKKTEEEEEDIRWARREIVERCIFGVDLNPLAVELAKVSLWLHTISKNRPLNFLDHHLRCGNSLIGAKINELKILPQLKKKEVHSEGSHLFEDVFQEKINILLGDFALLEKLPSDTIENIRKKEKYYQHFLNTISRFKDVADIWTSVYFGNEFGNEEVEYYSMLNNLKAPEEKWEEFSNELWFKKGKEIAEEKRFFHWELEFPEIFFEKDRRKENPGFDVVIGNPPYGPIFTQVERYFIELNFPYSRSNKNGAMVFIEKGLGLKKIDGFFGFIVPKSLSFSQKWASGRHLVIEQLGIALDVSKAFEEVLLEEMIIVVSNAYTQRKFYKSAILFEDREIAALPVKKEVVNLSDTLLLGIDKKELKVFEEIFAVSFFLTKISKSVRGLPFQKFMKSNFEQKGIPIYRGDHIARFTLFPTYESIPTEVLKNAQEKAEFLRRPKILSQNIIAHVEQPAGHIILMATLDNNGILTLDTIENTILTDSKFSLHFIVSLINSKLISWYAYRFIFGKAIRTMHLEDYHIGKLPIRHISFVTPPDERKKLVEEFKKMYMEWIEK